MPVRKVHRQPDIAVGQHVCRSSAEAEPGLFFALPAGVPPPLAFKPARDI